MLMLKIKIILIYFQIQNTLKNNNYQTLKLLIFLPFDSFYEENFSCRGDFFHGIRDIDDALSLTSSYYRILSSLKNMKIVFS